MRQRKLLHIMQNQPSFLTSSQLARQLNVSPRTIRNDIAEINKNLEPFHTRIVSEKSKGYFFHSENPDILRQLGHMDNAFFTREERVRYLTFTLCLSDIPLNLYDLEEEIFVSHTTLEHDLNDLREKYVLSPPYISLIQVKDELSFEENERKRRSILNRLFHEDWNYNSKGNAYYGSVFLDEKILDTVSLTISHYLNLYSIRLEDPNRVMLDLAVVIMYLRVRQGHLIEDIQRDITDTPAWQATKDIMEALEKQLDIAFPKCEVTEIYTKIAGARLMDARQLNFSTIGHYFDYQTIHMANAYIQRIHKYFDLDFSADEDFYITLLQYIRYFQMPEHIFNIQENINLTRQRLTVEYEIAWLFQDIAIEYLGRTADSSELLYLALCISGAMEYLNQNIPERKIRAIICCHLNLPAMWALKRKLLGAFGCYMDVIELLPVNEKDSYDFTNIDLILSTTRKNIPVPDGSTVLFISPFLNDQDHRNIENYLNLRRTQSLYLSDQTSPERLFKEAVWHENVENIDKIILLKLLAGDVANTQEERDKLFETISRREKILSYAYHPGIAFVYALKPEGDPRLSVATMEHRILWNGIKIRTVIMAAIPTDQAILLFYLLEKIYQKDVPEDRIKNLRTKEEIYQYITNERK